MATFIWQNKSELSRPIASGGSGTEVEFTIQAVGPTSYTSGGEAFAAANIKAGLGIDSISFFECEELDNGTTLRKLTYDRTNNKLRAWLMASTVEGTSGTGTQVIWVEQTGSDDLHTFTYRLRIVGVRKADLSTLP